ncbi:MAG: hypothetical protein J6K31_14390 [Parabacteroides sp.]|nr:hypothetical protein [Parabacteroides sp.]
MTAIEMKMSLLQEVMDLNDDEQLIKKALSSIRRLKEKAWAKEVDMDAYVEPTKEQILADIREGLKDLKDLREGKDVGHKFMDAREWLKTLD